MFNFYIRNLIVSPTALLLFVSLLPYSFVSKWRDGLPKCEIILKMNKILRAELPFQIIFSFFLQNEWESSLHDITVHCFV